MKKTFIQKLKEKRVLIVVLLVLWTFGSSIVFLLLNFGYYDCYMEKVPIVDTYEKNGFWYIVHNDSKMTYYPISEKIDLKGKEEIFLRWCFIPEIRDYRIRGIY